MVHVQLNETHEKQVLSEALREEPFTLVLSAGFSDFFAHVGFLQALEELELQTSSSHWRKRRSVSRWLVVQRDVGGRT